MLSTLALMKGFPDGGKGETQGIYCISNAPLGVVGTVYG